VRHFQFADGKSPIFGEESGPETERAHELMAKFIAAFMEDHLQSLDSDPDYKRANALVQGYVQSFAADQLACNPEVIACKLNHRRLFPFDSESPSRDVAARRRIFKFWWIRFPCRRKRLAVPALKLPIRLRAEGTSGRSDRFFRPSSKAR